MIVFRSPGPSCTSVEGGEIGIEDCQFVVGGIGGKEFPRDGKGELELRVKHRKLRDQFTKLFGEVEGGGLYGRIAFDI